MSTTSVMNPPEVYVLCNRIPPTRTVTDQKRESISHSSNSATFYDKRLDTSRRTHVTYLELLRMQ